MRILLTGADGQLARDLHLALAKEEVAAFPHAALDICDREQLFGAVRQARPTCLINTAAFNRVDDSEDQPEQALRVNAVGAYNAARAANEVGAVVVHFSTDYVFDGKKTSPYRETDAVDPLSVYGMSKFLGEMMVRRYAQRYFLIRTCGLYGHAGRTSKNGNFVETMLRLANQGVPIRVVNDQVVSPTSTQDLAAKTAELIRTSHFGLYHITSAGQCSWHEFAREIFRLARLEANLEPVSSATYGARAQRPAYSVLDHRALRRAGFADLRPWQEALADYIRTHRRTS